MTMSKALIVAFACTVGVTTPGAAQQPAPPVPPAPRGVPGGGPENGMNTSPPNGAGQKPAVEGQTRAPEQKLGQAFTVVTVAEGLQNPWSLAFLPGGKMLVTERPGRLRVLAADGTLSKPVAGLPAVDDRGQGGLLEVALDPAFAKNRLIYVSYAEPAAEAGMNNTAVARGTFVDDAADPRVDGAAGDLPPAAVAGLAAALRRPADLRPRRHAVHHPGRSLDHRGPDAGAEARERPRQDRPHQHRRLDPQGQPVCRQGGRAAGDLVVRPPQHPVGDAATRPPASCGRSSTAPAAATS